MKIITTAYSDDDDTLHLLSAKESETFRNMIVDMIVSKLNTCENVTVYCFCFKAKFDNRGNFLLI